MTRERGEEMINDMRSMVAGEWGQESAEEAAEWNELLKLLEPRANTDIAGSLTDEELLKLSENAPYNLKFVPKPVEFIISTDNTIEFKPGCFYLVFFDPSKVLGDDLARYCQRPDPAPFEATFIPSLDGHTPTYIESIDHIEKWLTEVKSKSGGSK